MMAGVMIGTCEFCGEPGKVISSNVMHGWYCRECLENAIIEIQVSLQEVEKEEKRRERAKTSRK